VNAVDSAQDSSGVAVPPPATPAAEEAALPPVDWRLVGGEATSAAGRVRSRRGFLAAARCLSAQLLPWQVITAQANYMRVLVRWQDLTPAQRELRRSQLQVSCAYASSAPYFVLMPSCLALPPCPPAMQAALQAAADAGASKDVASLAAELAYEARLHVHPLYMSCNIADSCTNGQGPLEVLCVVRAMLKKMQQRVLVGDWVALSGVEWTARRGMVSVQLPRTGPPLTDPPVSNVEQVVMCFALADPPVEAVQLTRFLVSAEASGLPFVLVFNKADLGTMQRRLDVAEHMRLWGYSGSAAPRFVSVATGEGTAELTALLAGKVTAIAGPSGVGKSSLINAMRSADGSFDTAADAIGAGGGNKSRVTVSGGGAADWEDALEDDASADNADDLVAAPAWEVQTVKAISGRSRRGRHTTRHVSLLRLPGGGLLADTPGFGLPSLDDVTTRSLPDCFPEVRAALAAAGDITCAFANCTHRDEPDCVARGDPPWERYPLYRELYEELAMREAAAARIGGKRETGVRTKAARGSGTTPRVEVKLNMNKHRRVSRTNANAQLQGELGRMQAEDDEAE